MSVTFKSNITKQGNIKVPEEITAILGTEPSDEVIVNMKFASDEDSSGTGGILIPFDILREAGFDLITPIVASVGDKLITIDELEDDIYE